MILPCYICEGFSFWALHCQHLKVLNMTENQLFKAARSMRHMGSFAAAIGEAFFVADTHNRETLVKAFKGLFERACELNHTNTTEKA